MKQSYEQLQEDVGAFRDLFIDYQQFDVSVRGASTYGGADGQLWCDWHSEAAAASGRFDDWKTERGHIKRNFRSKLKAQMRDPRQVKGKRHHNAGLTEAVRNFHKNPNMETLGHLADKWYASSQPVSISWKFPDLAKIAEQEVKFWRNEWKEPPWDQQPWFVNHWTIRSHGAHFSLKQEGMLAYTQSLDKLRRDIQTPVKPGKYLREFFPELSDEQVREWAHKFEAKSKPAQIEFIKNTDPAGWVEAWSHEVQASDSNATSCMTDKDCVRVYAHPENNLTLAIVRNPDDDSVIARAICHLTRKQFVRAYTKRSVMSSNTFMELLKAAGYERDEDCLRGEKLQRIEHYRDNRLVCPYIDGGYQYVEDCGSYLRIVSDGIGATNTGGYTDEAEPEYSCSECGDGCDGDDLTYVGVHGDDGVCEHCLNRHYTYAFYRGAQYYFADCDVIQIDDEWYEDSSRNMDYYNFVKCDYSSAYYAEDDLTDIAGGDRVQSDNLSAAGVVKLDVEHDDCEYAYEGDTVTLSDGRVVHENDAEELQAEIDEAEVELEDGSALIPVAPATDHTPQEQFAFAA